MLAKDNVYIADAASTVYKLSQKEMIRLQCEARENYYRTQLGLSHEIDKWKTSADELTIKNKALISENKTLFLRIKSSLPRTKNSLHGH